MLQQLRALLRHDQEGATAVEYGVMVALIAVVIIAGVTTLGGNLDTLFEDTAGDIEDTGE